MTSFGDNFNRADGDPGANWVQVSGTWSIVSQQLSPGSSGATIVIRAATSMTTSDNYAEVTIAATSAVSQGVMCRGDSTLANGYLWRNNGSNWGLFKAVSGTFTAIGSTYAAAAAPGDVARVQAVGSTIKGFVNGVERASVVDTAVTSGTSVGIRSQSTSALRYDDFSAADVVTGATLPIAGSIETAQTLTGTKTAALGTATETGTAQTLTGTKTATLTPAIGLDTAQALTGAKGGTLAPAGSVESAQPLTGAVTAVLPTADAAETAQPLTGAKTAVLVPALEVDTARPLAELAVVVPSAERTFRIPAERRLLAVAAERRILTIRR